MEKLTHVQGFKELLLVCRRTCPKEHRGMSLCDFCQFFHQLQYCIKKIISTFTLLMNVITKSKESNVLYYGQVVFSLHQFHFLHFLQCVVISHFHNNEYMIISSSTRGVTDVSGICFFKKLSIKIVRLIITNI